MIRATVLLLALGSVARAAPIPRAYELTLEPDAAHGRFTGQEDVELELDAPARAVRLDASGLEVTEALAIVDGRRRPARVRRLAEAIELRFDAPLPAGRAIVRLAWRGQMATTLRGLYVADSHGERYVFTQLEPDAARKVFPCFDEPALRASFVLHVVVDRDQQAVSNGPAISEQRSDDGARKTITFAPTPPLPTYLVSLAVGRFEETTGRAGMVPVRVLAPPGHRAEAAAALDTAVELLGALERYLDVAFPFAKLDVVAVPHLGPHAMENAGAIFVRADELLVPDGAGAEAAQHRRARRLAHELAHQWFGDLVTMACWNDLWLSEGLARWAEFEMLDRAHAAWRVRDQFRALRDRAISHDAHAHAIRPAGSSEGPAFDQITYDKGAATLRMLQVWMGDDAFRTGLRRYLTTRAFGAASSEQFWAALGGPAVSEVARGWFERRGHPRVRLAVGCVDGAVEVHLRQQAPAGEHGGWEVPLVLRTPTTTLHLVMSGPTASVRLREPGRCSGPGAVAGPVAVEDEGELPFTVRYDPGVVGSAPVR